MTVRVINNVEALEAIDKIQQCNLPCLLLGETGTGKTTLVKAVAAKYKKTLTRINLNGQTGREELIGKYVLLGGETKRQDGPLLTALKHGHWILLDEINAALPEVLFTIQALTESVEGTLGNLLLAEKDGEIITPHNDCRIFGTANPSDKYVGTKAFNPATLSRFIVINIENLTPSDEHILLTERYPHVKTSVITKLTKIGADIRKATKDEKIEFFCSTRELVNTTALVDAGLGLEYAVTIGILNKVQNRFELTDVKKLIDSIVKLPDKEVNDERELFLKSKDEMVRLLKENAELQANIATANEMNAQAQVIIKKFSEAIKKFTEKGLMSTPTSAGVPSTDPLTLTQPF